MSISYRLWLAATVLFMGGKVKFFKPFNTMFANQIALCGLPFPTLSKWAGQLREISTGIALLALLIFGKKLSTFLVNKFLLPGKFTYRYYYDCCNLHASPPRCTCRDITIRN